MTEENQNINENNVAEQNQITNYSNYSHNSKANNKVNSELLKHLELIDNENCQLKEALTELQVDLKQKDSSIEESNKIITKLKDEYSKLIKEYQNLENINNELLVEAKNSQNIIDSYNKQNKSFTDLQQKNINLTNDINKLKNENIEMKNKILAMNEFSWKNEEEMKNKELIVKDLTSREKNLVEMIKDREKLINEQSKKIVELNDIITLKDDQLKILVNFSKEINKENKNNVKEITRQACETIKLFNHNNKINSQQNNNINFLTDDNKLLIKNDKTTFAKYIPLLKQNKTSFALKDAINSMLFIPKDVDNKIISKEFLVDMNFKSELVKSELFASLLRESQFINFLDDLLSKLNLSSENKKILENIGNIQSKLNMINAKLDELIKENNALKLQKIKLLQNQEDNNLYVKKLKDSVSKGLKKIRDRYQSVGNNNNNIYGKKNKNENKNKINKAGDKYNKNNVNRNKIPKEPMEEDYGFESTKDFENNYDKKNIGNNYYNNQNYFTNPDNIDRVNRGKYNPNFIDDNMLKSTSLTYFWNDDNKNNTRNSRDVNTQNLRKYANKNDKNRFSCSSCSYKNKNCLNNYNNSNWNYS